MRSTLSILVLLVVLAQLAVCGPLNTRVKRQYMGSGMGMGTGMGMGGGMGLGGGYRSGYMGGGYMGSGMGMGGGLTPEQMIANRELAISQARTRNALVASEIATNQAVREAAIINAETRLAAAETGLMMRRPYGGI